MSPRLIAIIFYFSLRSVVSSSSNSPCCRYHWRYSIKSNQFISITSTSRAQNYAKNRFQLTFSCTVIPLLSAFVWAPTWRIASVVKAEVTWVKTKNTSIKSFPLQVFRQCIMGYALQKSEHQFSNLRHYRIFVSASRLFTLCLVLFLRLFIHPLPILFNYICLNLQETVSE